MRKIKDYGKIDAKAPSPPVAKNNYQGFTIKNCNFDGRSGLLTDNAANALKALADASAEHGRALQTIAKLLDSKLAEPLFHIGDKPSI